MLCYVMLCYVMLLLLLLVVDCISSVVCFFVNLLAKRVEELGSNLIASTWLDWIGYIYI